MAIRARAEIHLAKVIDGVSISKVETFYLTNNSITAPSVSSGSWSETFTTPNSTNKILWTYSKTTLSNNSVNNSNPCIIATYTEDGKSVQSIKQQYYVSTSKSTPTSGSWEDSQPSWESGKFLFIRQVVTYKLPNGNTSVETGTPYCDSAWEKVTEVNQKFENLKIGGRNLLQNTEVTEDHLSLWGQSNLTQSIVTDNGQKCYQLVTTSTEPIGSHGEPGCRTNYGALRPNTDYIYHFWIYTTVAAGFSNGSIGHMQCSISGDTNRHHETGCVYSPANIPANTWTHCTVQFKVNAICEMVPYLWYLPKNATIKVRDFMLEEGTKPSAWQLSPEDIQSKIDDVKIGGRNIIKNSGTRMDKMTFGFVGGGNTTKTFERNIGAVPSKTAAKFVYTSAPTANAGIYISPANYATDIIAGKTYTFSCWMKADRNVPIDLFNLEFADGAAPLAKEDPTLNTSWQRISITTKAARTVNSSSSGAAVVFYSTFGNIPVNTTFWISSPMLEEGNKCSDWQPAPEDAENALNETKAELKVETDSIRASVSSVQAGAANQFKDQQAQLDQLKATQSITLEVAEKWNDCNVTLTATVYASGRALTDDERTALGCLGWYINGNRVSVSNPFNTTVYYRDLVECRLESGGAI